MSSVEDTAGPCKAASPLCKAHLQQSLIAAVPEVKGE